MCRLDILLDPVRATTLRCALDQSVAAWIREKQYDHTEALPEDVRTTEQMYAHALTRLAEVYLDASPVQRGAKFSPEAIYTAPLHDDGGLAESVYGALVPRAVIPAPTDPNAHILQLHNGQPVLLDGQVIDKDPTARLASRAQRIGLAVRDRHCTYPGCSRPPTFALHAHHREPYRDGGATVVHNMSLYCSEHHTMVHHPGPAPRHTSP
jgi:Domain of unknown function (DUF222)